MFTFIHRLIDESPRWLWGQGRKDEAVKIIQKALKVNKNNVSLTIEKEQMETLSNIDPKAEKPSDQSFSILDLFKTPNLRKNTMNVCLFW